MPVLYSIWAIVLLLAAPAMAQQPQPQPQPQPSPVVTTGYMVFLKGTPVGREELTVTEDGNGLTLTGQGRLAAPLNVVTRQAVIRYRRDASPETLIIDASIGGEETSFRTNFIKGEGAVTEGKLGGQPVKEPREIFEIQPFVLPNVFVGSYVAVARQLARGAQAEAEYPVYLGPQLPRTTFRSTPNGSERVQTGLRTFLVNKYDLVFAGQGTQVAVTLYVDERGSLVRLTVPGQGLEFIRDDVSSPLTRTAVFSNPGDEPVTIPGTGFNIGATLTHSASSATGAPAQRAARAPAVILLASAEAGDRDGVLHSVPTIAQLAGTLAEAGFLVVRYDKRGVGQTGGRSESATLSDYAEDVRGIVRWLRTRPEVDRDRIALVGHGEGAWVALLAASRDRNVAAVATIAAPSTTGQELVLEQQRLALEQANTPAAERAERVALQQRINAAVISGRGWEGIPDAVRKQADTPFFQSLLSYDPAKVMEGVRQPLLLVHGQLDQQVPVNHVERLTDLARKVSDSKSVEVITVRGVNHLLVPAITGHVSEYPELDDRMLSPDVTNALNAWLLKTFKTVNN